MRKFSPMMSQSLLLSCFAFLLYGQMSASAQTLPNGNPISGTMPTTTFTLRLEEVATLPDSSSGSSRFARIEQMTPLMDGSGNVVVSDQRGRIYTLDPSDANPTPTLNFDFAANIPNFKDGNQQSGLRGFAYHPNAFSTDVNAPGYRKMYTAHEITTASGGNSHTSVVSEWSLNSLGRPINNSRRDILTETQPRVDHNIGKIGFNPNLSPSDPDYGNLYISFGDGGNYRAPSIGGSDLMLNPNGQITTNFLGSMLRINPLQDGGNPYSVPANNPFVSDAGIEDEIWAYGLRNPHQFSWDTGGNGEMLIADIGQSNIEEINFGVAGANYGWAQREGTFDVAGKLPIDFMAADVLPANHPTDPYTYPVVQYDHDYNNNNSPNNAAIAGGFVYRGTLVSELVGKYIFGNFGSDVNSQDIFVVDVDQLQLRDDFTNLSSLNDGFLAPVQRLALEDSNGNSISFLDLVRQKSGNSNQQRTDMRFGIDEDGEIYITSKKDGTIRRFIGTPLPDFDTDGDLDGADFLEWQRGVADTDVLDLWRQNYGAGNNISTVATVPEPTAAILLLLGLATVSSRRATSRR